ncbi:MAG TPA: hypothetical protein VIG69_03000, partial [Candidatus Methylomirabilis sp.]
MAEGRATTDTTRVHEHLRQAGIGLLLAILLFPLVSSQSSAGDRKRLPCRGKQGTLDCLKANFEQLYEADYHRFFQILHAAE